VDQQIRGGIDLDLVVEDQKRENRVTIHNDPKINFMGWGGRGIGDNRGELKG